MTRLEAMYSELRRRRLKGSRLEYARSIFPFEMDKWQQDALLWEGTEAALRCARQTGKSTVVSGIAGHVCRFEPGSLVLIFARALRQSFELFDKVRPTLMDEAVEYNKHEVRLRNGSRVICLPGSPDTVRGFSKPRAVICEEAAFMPDALFEAILPMMAASPKCELWLLSSPNGKVGYFYEKCMERSDHIFKCKVPATDCSRISKDFIEKRRRDMSKRAFEQEIMCEFRDHNEQVFTEDMIEAAFSSDDVQPLNLEAP